MNDSLSTRRESAPAPLYPFHFFGNDDCSYIVDNKRIMNLSILLESIF